MAFLDKLRDRARFAERWAGRRLGEFADTGRRVGKFVQKASRKVGDFAGKGAIMLAEATPALAAIPGVGEELAAGAVRGVEALEGIREGSEVVGQVAGRASGYLNKADKLSGQLRQNKYLGGLG
jgi:hypothetical protein